MAVLNGPVPVHRDGASLRLDPPSAEQVGAVRGRVDGFERRPVEDEGLRRAAVACLVALDPDGQLAFVLTRRNSRMRDHAGQWAIPGGRVDDGESLADAARRELSEEVGVVVGADSVVGLLDDYPTRSGYRITPVVVCLAEPVVMVPDPGEVAEVHVIPFAALDRDDSPRFVSIPESDRPVVQLPLLDDLIHAPTAAVVHQFHQLVVHGRTVRVDHLEQPVFAWK